MIYLSGYGLIRFVMEFVRIDETAMVFGWRLPQLVGLIMFLGGAISLLVILRKSVGIKNLK